MTDGSDIALVAALQSLTLTPDQAPSRPDFGQSGAPIKLRSNFFKITAPKKDLYEYDVAITPVEGTANKRVKRRIFQLAEASPTWQTANLKGLVAHDHSSKLIASKKLPDNVQIKVKYYDEDKDGPDPNSKEYTLTLKFIQAIETSSLMK